MYRKIPKNPPKKTFQQTFGLSLIQFDSLPRFKLNCTYFHDDSGTTHSSLGIYRKHHNTQYRPYPTEKTLKNSL